MKVIAAILKLIGVFDAAEAEDASDELERRSRRRRATAARRRADDAKAIEDRLARPIAPPPDPLDR